MTKREDVEVRGKVSLPVYYCDLCGRRIDPGWVCNDKRQGAETVYTVNIGCEIMGVRGDMASAVSCLDCMQDKVLSSLHRVGFLKEFIISGR